MEGVTNKKPHLTKISFQKENSISFELKDGRIISVPLSLFPSIKKLKPQQKRKWQIIDEEGFSFDDLNEVYHIEQVLGRYEDYRYQF